jgi:hypothetical protein
VCAELEEDFMARPARNFCWEAILADLQRSGLTQVQFCRRRRVMEKAITRASRHENVGYEDSVIWRG